MNLPRTQIAPSCRPKASPYIPGRAPGELHHRVSVIAFKGCQFSMDIMAGLEILDREKTWRVDSELLLVRNIAQAKSMGLYGSPTIIVDGREYQDWRRGPAGLYCRAYLTPRGFSPCPDPRDVLSGRDHIDELALQNRETIEPLYPTLFAAAWCPQSQATRRFWQEAAGIANCPLRVLDADSREGTRQMLRLGLAGVPCLMASPTRFVYGTPASLTRAADFLRALHDNRKA